MTNAVSPRAEAVSEKHDQNVKDNASTSGQQALSTEAVSNFSPNKTQDLAGSTNDLVNKNVVPKVELFDSISNNTLRSESSEGKAKSNGDQGTTVGANKQQEMKDSGDGNPGIHQEIKPKQADQSFDFRGAKAENASHKGIEDAAHSKFDKSELAGDKNMLNSKSDLDSSIEDNEPLEGAQGVAASIAKNGGLGEGEQGEKNRKALEKAFNEGTLEEFTKEVNAQLEKAGSPYRVNAQQYKEAMTYRKNEGNKSIVEQEHVRDNPRANISVTNTKTGHSYQVKQMASDPEMPGHYPPSKVTRFSPSKW